jgi:hypothetical protein
MFRNEKEEKFVDKMIKNSIMRKSKYFRRNLCINLKQTTIKIIKIKNIDDLKTKLLGLHI